MSKVKSLRLGPGTRVGAYELSEPLGKGCEGEVYACSEVPSEAKRAIKLIARENVDSVRQIIATAWFFEQLAETRSVARYYHMGQWFRDDSEGHYYLIFERLSGPNLVDFLAKAKGLNDRAAIRLVVQVAAAIERVHRIDYAVGDFEDGTNIVVTGDADDPRPVFCDVAACMPDRPNQDYQADAKALVDLSALVFKTVPRSASLDRVRKALLEASEKPNTNTTFTHLVAELRAL
jgi:serine/threonine protein kinase